MFRWSCRRRDKNVAVEVHEVFRSGKSRAPRRRHRAIPAQRFPGLESASAWCEIVLAVTGACLARAAVCDVARHAVLRVARIRPPDSTCAKLMAGTRAGVMGTAGDVLGIWRGAGSGQEESIVSGREARRQIDGLCGASYRKRVKFLDGIYG